MGSNNITPNTFTESWPIGLDSMGNSYECGVLINQISGVDTNVVVFGHDTIYNTGYEEIIVVSADSTGNYRWGISTNGGAAIISMVTDPSGNIYLLGYYDYGTFTFGTQILNSTSGATMYFLGKINSSGNVLWLKNIAPVSLLTTEVSNAALAMDGTTDLYITGTYIDSAITIGSTTLYNSDPAGTTTDVFFAKFDTAGTPIWAKSIGGDSSEVAQSIAVTRSGDVYLAGTFYSDTLLISDTLINPTGGAVPYFFIAKYNTSGNTVWAKEVAAGIVTTTTVQSNVVNGLTTDNQDNVYMACTVYDTVIFGTDTVYNNIALSQAIFAAYSSSGNVKFARSLTSNTSLDSAYICDYAVAADNCGNIWISGSANLSTLDGMFLSEYDTTGTLINTMIEPAGGDDQSNITVDNKGHLYVGGDYLYAPFYIGTDTLTLSGSSTESLFILKLSYPYDFCPLPVLNEVKQLGLLPGFNVYPNPATTVLMVTSNEKINQLIISNILGQTIYTHNYNDTEVQVDVAALPPALYFVKINGSETKKFIKE